MYDSSNFLKTYPKDQITAELVGKGVSYVDETCIRIIMNSGYALGSVLAKIVNFFNPSMIIIGGRVSLSGHKFISSMIRKFYIKDPFHFEKSWGNMKRWLKDNISRYPIIQDAIYDYFLITPI